MTTQTLNPATTTIIDEPCDECGSKAYVHTVLATGSLYWCNHHWHQHREALTPQVLYLNDQTKRLYAAVKPEQ